ncbi:ABC transporter permease [Aetokthonos hydrillicola Thurmond2011]|jgi:ABC-2 type transport system permease protein|uniref:Transport permease protein n=1 Tax=Aetokthonos hydrillicola Thurmond2011 TaxID=2712845 RepID=A0AAP5M7Y2_9CYAN|nr:ABC transporter permease [Aetokthonos hydrillicola]MBO3458584.1 ABC transporter permease [Aetokthonos hydrillicola CCALA 1050]MBW4585027.1 ABC transporter permease [Aetokthonos hydrillicola CCALA 1050]MDR9894212.1 ABC transporter permease [Aetokthonos hydrillicola Thurmond2011]
MRKKRFTNFIDTILGSRFWALFQKEFAQILRNRQLIIQLLVPPTVFLMLFGFALNPKFHDLKVGITDYSHSSASREFIEIFQQTDAFVISHYYANQQDMLTDLAKGSLTVGIIIPPEFNYDIAHKRTVEVQALYDAVDANTATIASSYVTQLVSDYNIRQLNNAPQLAKSLRQRVSGSGVATNSALTQQSTTSSSTTNTQQSSSLQRQQVQVTTTVLYNPGLEPSWFIVSGIFGVLLTVIGSQAAASLVVSEKEAGTIEQLVMTPASNTEVILAKVSPLLILLTLDLFIALSIARLVFGVPFQGNLLVFVMIAVLYFLVGISIGIIIATFSKSQQQTQLSAFFINPPLVILSGATTPISSMPTFVQWVTYFDPLRYFIEVSRGVLLKGVGLETLWFQVVILLIFATVLITLSVRQFRSQLS